MEHIVATRMSLLAAVRQRAQRAQIGDRPTSFTSSVAALEKQCLVSVSAAARDAGALQIALNAVVRAQRLDGSEKSSSVAQEFANVLWAKGEHKLAIEFLREIVGALPTTTDGDIALLQQVVLRSRLVRLLLSTRSLGYTHVTLGVVVIRSLHGEAGRNLGNLFPASNRTPPGTRRFCQRYLVRGRYSAYISRVRRLRRQTLSRTLAVPRDRTTEDLRRPQAAGS